MPGIKESMRRSRTSNSIVDSRKGTTDQIAVRNDAGVSGALRSCGIHPDTFLLRIPENGQNSDYLQHSDKDADNNEEVHLISPRRTPDPPTAGDEEGKHTAQENYGNRRQEHDPAASERKPYGGSKEQQGNNEEEVSFIPQSPVYWLSKAEKNVQKSQSGICGREGLEGTLYTHEQILSYRTNSSSPYE
jgi:hypothetical protein